MSEGCFMLANITDNRLLRQDLVKKSWCMYTLERANGFTESARMPKPEVLPVILMLMLWLILPSTKNGMSLLQTDWACVKNGLLKFRTMTIWRTLTGLNASIISSLIYAVIYGPIFDGIFQAKIKKEKLVFCHAT